MALVERFKKVAQGAMVLTGNTLNVMKDVTLSTADWENGAYISTNTALVAATGFPAGTTFNPANSSSSAILKIPANSTVLYAQLWWTIGPDPGASRDNSISFTTPAGSNTLTATISLSDSGSSGLYYRGLDVTNIIQNAGSGTYTLGNIPGPTLSNATGKYTAAAWYLLVVYENFSLPYRYFNVNTGLVSVSNGAPSSFTFSNIATPSQGTVSGYLLISETYGDLDDGAQVYVGTASPGVRIGNTSTTTWDGNAPYARNTNMFPANILVADTNDSNIGLLDTRGTFGSYNKNPFAKSAPAFSRINADIAGFNISSNLSNNQTSLFTQVSYGGSGSGYVTSQSVQVDLNAPSFSSFAASVDYNYAAIGDVLTYTLNFSNAGLATASTVVFVDTMPSGLSFVAGSLIIDGVTSVSGNPSIPGISLGDFTVATSKTITFKAKINSLPSPNPIKKTSNITFNFLLAANLDRVYSSVVSKVAVTTINYVDLTAIQSTNSSFSSVGGTIKYSVNLNNAGNISANNVVVLNTIPNLTSFVTDSLKINGVTLSGVNPNSPLSIGTIPVGVTTLTFDLVVTTIPSTTYINSNPTSISYNYMVNSNTYIGGANSNSSAVKINQVYLSGVKSSNRSYAYMGDEITYYLYLNNTGTTIANNVTVLDTIPSGTSFVANSLISNGVTKTGLNPNLGANIGSLFVGLNTVSFRVLVTTIPSTNNIVASASISYNFTVDPSIPSTISGSLNTNSSIVTVNYANLKCFNSPANTYSTLGSEITYIIKIGNQGNISADNVIILDTIPTQTAFIANSVQVNGVKKVGLNPTVGANVGSLPVGLNTITFRVTVLTIPSTNRLYNMANISYNFVPDIVNPRTIYDNVNTDTSTVVVNYSELKCIKTVDKNTVRIGEVLTYTITVKNMGNVATDGVVVTDKIPDGLTFIANSVTVNNVSVSDTIDVINVGYIISGGTATVTFKARVDY